MGTCIGTFLFILGFFLLLELLDRTLRDSIRTRRLVGLPMLGAFPKKSTFEYRGYIKECEQIAIKHLSSSILRFCNKRKEGLPYIINFISARCSGQKMPYELFRTSYSHNSLRYI